MEQKGSVLKSSLNYGLITGIALIVFSLITWMFDVMFAQGINLLVYIILIVGIVLGVKNHRDKANGGFLTYGQGLGVGTLVAVVAAIISSLFSVLLMEVIDPTLMDKMLAVAEEQLVKQNLTEEQIEMALDMQKKWLGYAWAISIFVTALAGFIVSLIVAAIFKKNDDSVMA